MADQPRAGEEAFNAALLASVKAAHGVPTCDPAGRPLSTYTCSYHEGWIDGYDAAEARAVPVQHEAEQPDAVSRGCSHDGPWTSAPVTAENETPDIVCPSCGAVMIPGAYEPWTPIGPETRGDDPKGEQGTEACAVRWGRFCRCVHPSGHDGEHRCNCGCPEGWDLLPALPAPESSPVGPETHGGGA